MSTTCQCEITRRQLGVLKRGGTIYIEDGRSGIEVKVEEKTK